MNWYMTLTGWLQQNHFLESVNYQFLFLNRKRDMYLYYHVDALTVIGGVEELKIKINENINFSEARSPDVILGMTIAITDSVIRLNKRNDIDKGVKLVNMEEYRPL
ncbi:hypothetical protein O181_081282 [Austropuccinia psidii MF-1]|uniref:Uncharacterized protein n=1 Tax=Austropuccinia psidii MF-1 TaxID=1389203 RepID=A0A9Q3FNA9_9BASI|nr:hypothetical protein [Austropuccinia psidii MF-1]